MIVEVDGKPTPSVEALETVLGAATRNKQDSVPLLVGFERAGQRLLTVIDVGEAGLEDPGLEARKAWVPVSVQVLTRELADKLGLGEATGVRVTQVLSGGGGFARPQGRRRDHRGRRRRDPGLAAVRRRPLRDPDPAVQDWLDGRAVGAARQDAARSSR